ncbi:MAG: FG-GAP repeat protein [Planctomycetes bacterium]|nr:FG-GAP repeat protein [Planctomycetota bacterium]
MDYSSAGMRARRGLVSVVAAALGVISAPAWGQCELEKLLASDGEAFDEFGKSVAISGDVAVIGSHLADGNGIDAGAAYVYRFNGSKWVEESKLLASDESSGDHFGTSVAISGDAIIAGAPQNSLGAAYIYRYDGVDWVAQTQLLNTFFGDTTDEYGRSVAMSGAAAIVGVPFGRDIQRFQTDSGRADIYRFVGTEWLLETRVSGLDPNSGDQFGSSVAMAGDIAIVGEPGNDEAGFNRGAAYAFHHDGTGSWGRVQIIASDGISQDHFGTSVAIDGELAIVGAPQDDDNGNSSGSAYVYRFDGLDWVEETKLLASDGMPDDNFGFSVSVSGDLALVGGGDAAYIFRYDGSTWIEEAKLEASDGLPSDAFGTTVAIDAALAIAGAPLNNDNGKFSGSAYVFSVDLDAPDCNGNGIPDPCEPDCNGNGVADECDITSGTSQDCNGNGIPDECDVANGTSEDCDGDEIPDDCQTLYFVDTSPPLGPIGDGFPQTYVISDPPEPSPQPTTEVLISLMAHADLSAPTEWIEVFLNGQLIGTVFEQGNNDCPDLPDEEQLTLDVATFNTLVAGGDAEFQLVASFAVDPALCADSSITVQVEYQATTDDDCNGNAVPDICDIINGDLSDDNGNWIPDECECVGDLDGDGSVGILDLLALLAAWGSNPGHPADFDGDGTVGVLDLLTLLASWGACG